MYSNIHTGTVGQATRVLLLLQKWFYTYQGMRAALHSRSQTGKSSSSEEFISTIDYVRFALEVPGKNQEPWLIQKMPTDCCPGRRKAVAFGDRKAMGGNRWMPWTLDVYNIERFWICGAP